MSVGTIVNDLADEAVKKTRKETIGEPAADKTIKPGLSEIVSGKQHRPRKLLLYGIPGVGKSTFAAGSPNPIFVPTEEGVNEIDVDKFPLSTKFDEFWSRLEVLAKEKHDYQTCVIDSLDWLERLIHAEVCREKGVTNIDEIGYGKGYTHAIDRWQKVLRGLAYLRDTKGMHIVLLAHSQIVKFENPETDNYDRYIPKLHHKTATPLITEWCDEVLFAGYQVFTNTTEEGFGKKAVKAVGGEKRILRCVEKPFCVAKNRLNMPTEISLLWSEYANYFPE